MAFDPIPVPVRGSATFNADAEAFAQGMSQFATDYNALSSVIDGALTSTSTTSLTIGTGSKVLTVQTGLGYVVGYPLRISSSASPTNYMDGIVTAYNSGTGSLTVNVSSVSGSGTIAAWNTMVLPGGGNFAGLTYNKFTQRQVLANEVSIASASTVDFTAGNSNQFVITGTTSITAVTIDQGAVVKARFASACQLTHGTNLQVQGGANYTTSAGDIATFTSNGTVVRVEIARADGNPVIPTTPLNATSDSTFTSTSSTDVVSPEWVNGKALIKTNSKVDISTGQAFYDVDIPQNVKNIKIIIVNASTNGTSNPIIRLHTSAGVVTTGYVSRYDGWSSSPITQNTNVGFGITDTSIATGNMTCTINIDYFDGLTWVESHTGGGLSGSDNFICSGSGYITLSEVMTKVRLTTINGTDTFDAGSLMVSWQY